MVEGVHQYNIYATLVWLLKDIQRNLLLLVQKWTDNTTASPAVPRNRKQMKQLLFFLTKC